MKFCITDNKLGGTVLIFKIDEKTENLTVLSFIKRNTDISSGHLKKLKFKPCGILVNGEHVTVRYTLKNGDLLTLSAEDGEEDASGIDAVDLPLKVVYEDSDCIVPSKPSGMPTHPSHGHYNDTVANALAFRAKKSGAPFVFRPVNRLDRNTSGLLLIAKNRISAGILSRSMANGEIKKAYIAILCGTLEKECGIIDVYMRRTAQSIIVREVCKEGEGGDYALTVYRTLAKTQTHTLVAASPITGRTHQLRVHFASLGTPLLGDELYGKPSSLISRHALHSAVLSFPSVSTDERLTFVSPIDTDMKAAVSELFGDGILNDELYVHCKELLFEIGEITKKETN